MARRIFIAVAEVSGDNHAAQLIRELKLLDPELIIEGVGGPEMEAAGAIIHRNTVTKAAMGLRGLLRAGEVWKLLRWTAKHFETHRPDLVIGVDSPSMNFHFAKLGKERGIPTLQYVAPQLWAWAIWRMKKVRRWVDQVTCILPFEEQFFRGHGVNATFVGHPIFDQLPPHTPTPAGERFPNRPPVIGLLAGSRKSEAEQNFPPMLATAMRLREAFPEATFLAPTTAATDPIARTEAEKWMSARGMGGPPMSSANQHGRDARATSDLTQPPAIQIGLGQFDEMVPRCDLCITVSGTATVHVAAYNVPMIVVYRGNPLVWNLLGRWIIPTRTFALVNVLATRAESGTFSRAGHIVPEFVPWYGGPDVGAMAIDMLKDPMKLEAQRADLARLISMVDKPGASKNTAIMALEMMNQSKAVDAIS